jgi:hypothetical protein
MSNDIRIRLTRLPSARDLEYFALKYLRLNGIYEVPLELAKDLIEFDYAMPSDGSEPLTSLGDARNLEEDID